MSDFPHIPSLIPAPAIRDTKRSPAPKPDAIAPDTGVHECTPVRARTVSQALRGCDDPFRTPARPGPADRTTSDDDSPPPLVQVKRASPGSVRGVQGDAVRPAAPHALSAAPEKPIARQSVRDELAEAQAASLHLLNETDPHLRDTYEAHLRSSMGLAWRELERMLASGSPDTEVETLRQLYLSVRETGLDCIGDDFSHEASPRDADCKQGPPRIAPAYASATAHRPHAPHAPSEPAPGLDGPAPQEPDPAPPR